jgi:hypothetical protein
MTNTTRGREIRHRGATRGVNPESKAHNEDGRQKNTGIPGGKIKSGKETAPCVSTRRVIRRPD